MAYLSEENFIIWRGKLIFMIIDKHFTVSVYVVHKDKVLLHQHKKTGRILPVGGHVDIGESQDETALRETREESGLEVELFNKKRLNNFKLSHLKEIITPMHTLLVEITPTHHHIDFEYYAYATTFELSPRNGESQKLMWLSEEEIKNNLSIPEDVRMYALEALELLGKRDKFIRDFN